MMYVVMLRTLPMLAIDPSTFWAIWVSISVGAAPGWLMLTLTIGYEMSGFRSIGSRRNATAPRKNSTTNSTIGVMGWRIAQAEMFFTSSPRPLGIRRSARPG